MAEEKSQSSQSFIRSIINFLQGIAFTLFLFTIILAIYFIVLYHARLTPYTNYAIVFDAGSSHTEMFVYNWPADKSDGLGTTSTVNEYFVCLLKPKVLNDSIEREEPIKLKAISDFERRLDLLDGYFQPCLTEAILRIPADRHKFSPIFLGATAGMRLTRLRNGRRSQQILETIREIFSNSPFQFVVARQVRILTGIEEAINGWITTNILLEKFQHRHVKTKNILQRIQSKQALDPDMAGVLDLGGASTQVTFTYNQNIDNEPIPNEFTSNVTLFDAVYSPYAHSYLCWGKYEALRRYRARLVNSAINENGTSFSNLTDILIDDPCLPLGANDTISLNTLFRSPCTANEKQKSNIYINKSSFIFVGIGNASQCRQHLVNLFDAKKIDHTVNCSYKQEYCTFDNTYQPKIPEKIQFIGLSGYYYVFNNLVFGMANSSRTLAKQYKLKDFSYDEILQRVNYVCETHYSVFYQEEIKNSTVEQYKRNLCFDAWYIWLLLTYAIGFTNETISRLTVADTFPTGKVGWTLGYMINQTNYIPAEYRERALKRNTYISWLTTSGVIGLIALIFLLVTCYSYCKKNSRKTMSNKNNHLQSNEQELA